MRQQKVAHFLREKRSFSLSSRAIPHPSSEYRTVFEILLIGSFVLIAIVSVLLIVSYLFFHHAYVINRIFLCALSLLYLAVTHIMWIRGRLAFASKLLILFYFFISTVILLGSGINTPFGLLIFAITIVLSGILLGARRTLYTAGLAIIVIFAIQIYISAGHAPLFSTASKPSHFGDAIAYSTLLAILALISWLFGQQTEFLFHKNRQAEQALIKEKELLEIRVRERTHQLQKAQLEEMGQLYQFAEMGQLSAALLHDLANHLSVLNFDIADLKKQQHTQTVRHVEESISYLEQAISQVRTQLQGKNKLHRFNVITCLKDSIKINAPKAAEAHTKVILQTPEKPVTLHGDPLRLNHILGILIRNAIESYSPHAQDKKVLVNLEYSRTHITIRVQDKGSGIATAQRKRLFAPLKSTKKDGLGIGLFIARKITETHFKGTLTLADSTDFTEFVLRLPKVQT